MTDVHAAIGNAQLGKLDAHNARRAKNAAYYDAHLKGVTIPFVPEGYKHVYHQYTIRVPGGKRDALREYLKEKEIGTEVYYPVPIHKQGFYMEEFGSQQVLPVTEAAALDVLSIPVHPSLSEADVEKIANTINAFMAGK
jgi:dTDP-4-amino-4,6-dideoxygalactose transaminase